MAAFPTHVWTILLFLKDFSFLAERTNAWNAVGVGAYGLLAALVESLSVFILALLAGLFISSFWDENRRVSLLSALILIAGLWAILGQFISGSNPQLPIPANLTGWIAGSPHPVWILTGLFLPWIALTTAVPTWFILKSDKTLRFFKNMIKRLSLLSAFYLLLDLAGLIIVILRNLRLT